DVFGFREGAAVEGADQTDLAGGDDGSIEDLDPEEVQVDPVGTRLEDIDLRPLLAAVFEKGLAALEIGMALDALPEEPPRRDLLTVHGGYDPDLPLVDIDGVPLGDIELVRVDPVFPRRGNLDLRPFLAAVGQKDLTGLKSVMPFDHLGKDPARRDRVAVDRFDDADLAVLDLDKRIFLRRIDEWDQEMEAGAEGPRLDTDFVPHGHNPALRHLLAEPAALHHCHLGPADDDDRIIGEHQQAANDDRHGKYQRKVCSYELRHVIPPVL